jgi:heptaprenylglyceryl phosphate synthase
MLVGGSNGSELSETHAYVQSIKNAILGMALEVK